MSLLITLEGNAPAEVIYVNAESGGMRNDIISRRIKNCLFEYNNVIYGGAMCNDYVASSQIQNVAFQQR